MWMIRRIGLAVLAVGLLPVVLGALGLALSSASGCVINEGSGVCPESPIGSMISTLLMLSLVSLLYAIPAYGLLVVWGIIELVHLVRGPTLD